LTIEPGTNLLHYRIVEKIGEGGMGVVWKALDTTLDRDVAIKVLPSLFAESPERLARFEREAKLLAALNHPNIATIHGLHEADGTRFIAEPAAMYRTRHGGRVVRMKVAPPVRFQGKTAAERRKFMEELRKTIVANREAIRVQWPAPTRPRTAPGEGTGDPLGHGSAQPG